MSLDKMTLVMVEKVILIDTNLPIVYLQMLTVEKGSNETY